MTPPVTFEWRFCAAQIAAAHGLRLDELMTRTRRKHISRTRWRMFALLSGRGWSLPQIARLWRMDHTTVLYGLRHLDAATRLHYQAIGALGRDYAAATFGAVALP